jgi:signal transduction histidine kinase
LVHLAANARDAMPRGGTLRVVTSAAHLDEAYAAEHTGVVAGRYVKIEVTDEGEGMSAEVLAHAFEPWFTTKEKGKGTGLGLATVYGVVHQAGGHVTIASEQGRGTTVTIYLPAMASGV